MLFFWPVCSFIGFSLFIFLLCVQVCVFMGTQRNKWIMVPWEKKTFFVI
jgi:hypothetical protein